MDLIIDKLGGLQDPRFFFGVNSALAKWLRDNAKNYQSMATKGLLSKKGVELDSVLDVLGLRNPLDRRQVSKAVIGSLWAAYPELGPYPAPGMLEQLEDKRVFYEEYREHALLHQFMVYLLGLYVYEHSELARTSLISEIRQEKQHKDEGHDLLEGEWIRRWLVAGTAHDVGYVLQSPGTDPNEQESDLWKGVRDKLEAILQYPVSSVQRLSDRANLAWEKFACNKLDLHTKTIDSPQTLVDIAHLDRLDPIAEAVGLGKADKSPILLRFYQFAQTVRPGPRPRHRDHGITSAIILLAVLNQYYDRINGLITRAPHTEVDIAPVQDDLVRLANGRQNTELSMTAACGAIALHNIDLSIWAENESAESDLLSAQLRPDQMLFALRAPSNRPRTKPAPLAFFLKFCDGLQDWDRPKFRRRQADDRQRELLDQDMSLHPHPERQYEGPLQLFIKNAAESRVDSHRSYKEFAGAIWKLMRPQDLDGLVQFDKQGTPYINQVVFTNCTFRSSEAASSRANKRPFKARDKNERTVIAMLKGSDIDEKHLVRCALTAAQQESCELRWQSVLTMAELGQLGRALQTTARVYDLVRNICLISEHLLIRALDLGTASKAMSHGPGYAAQLWDFAERLAGSLDKQGTRSDAFEKGASLSKFLAKRAADEHERTDANGFLARMREYCRLYGEGRDDNARIKLLVASEGKGVVQGLHDCSSTVTLSLRRVIESRTAGTYETITAEFKDFGANNLAEHFEKVNRKMPHKKHGHFAADFEREI